VQPVLGPQPLDGAPAALGDVHARVGPQDRQEPLRHDVVTGADVDVRNPQHPPDDVAGDGECVVHDERGRDAANLVPDLLRERPGKGNVPADRRPRLVVGLIDRAAREQVHALAPGRGHLRAELRAREHQHPDAPGRQPRDDRPKALEMPAVGHAEDDGGLAGHTGLYISIYP
jgi:hypothetical protein